MTEQDEEIISIEQMYKLGQNLKAPSCLPECLEQICSGWTLETFKQNMNKISKNNTQPIILYFDDSSQMDCISNKKQALNQTFALFDSFKNGRINTFELFSIFLFLSSGEYEIMLKHLVEVWGQEKQEFLNADEFFFFIDNLFKGLNKIILQQGHARPMRSTMRLSANAIQQLINDIFPNKIHNLNQDAFIQNMMTKAPKLNEFLYKIHISMSESQQYARKEQLQTMKTQFEIKKLLIEMTQQVEKRVQEQKLEEMFQGSTADEVKNATALIQKKYKLRKKAVKIVNIQPAVTIQPQQKITTDNNNNIAISKQIQQQQTSQVKLVQAQDEDKKLEQLFEGSTADEIRGATSLIQKKYKERQKAKQLAQQ